MKRTVEDVMTRSAVTVDAATPFKHLVETMQRHGVSALPVVDEGGRLVGIVTEADLLLKEEFAVEDTEPHLLEGRRRRVDRGRARAVTAGELMTSIRVRGVTSERSSSTSRRNSFSWRIGIGTGFAPANRVTDS